MLVNGSIPPQKESGTVVVRRGPIRVASFVSSPLETSKLPFKHTGSSADIDDDESWTVIMAFVYIVSEGMARVRAVMRGCCRLLSAIYILMF